MPRKGRKSAADEKSFTDLASTRNDMGGTCPRTDASSVEKARDKALKSELRKLVSLFSALPENEKRFLHPLFENAAFMKVFLDDLQIEIRETGAVEAYQNGEKQSGVKVSAAVQAYNQTIKNYNAVIDKLIDRLPAEEKKTDSLAAFRR